MTETQIEIEPQIDIQSEIEISKAGKLTGTPSLPGDFLLSSHATFLGALAKGATTLENAPASPWYHHLVETLRSLGYSIAQEGNTLNILGDFKPPEELDAPIFPEHEIVLMALGGIFAGFRSKNAISIDNQKISTSALDVFTRVFDCETLEVDSEFPTLKVLGLNPVTLKKFPKREYLVKTALLYYHTCSRTELEINCTGSGPDHLEKIIHRLCSEAMLTSTEQNLSEFEKRMARKKKAQTRAETKFSLPGTAVIEGEHFIFPGDVSLASVYILAATVIPGSNIELENVLLNPSRTTLITALRRMGANIEVTKKKDQAGEATGNIVVKYAELRGRKFAHDSIEGMRDEIPLLIVATALAEGESVIRDIQYLRNYQQDLLGKMVSKLREIHVDIGEIEDGLVIRGKPEYDGHTYDTLNNAMMGFAYMVLGLKSHGKSVLRNTHCMEYQFPGALEHLRLLAAA